MPDAFRIHGVVDNDQLQRTFRQMDVCIFSTREGRLGNGSFDGFPTGTAIEAGLASAAVVTTNPLAQASDLREGLDYFEIEPSGDSIVESLERLFGDRDLLFALQSNGRRAMEALFGAKGQLGPRRQLLTDLLSESSLTA